MEVPRRRAINQRVSVSHLLRSIRIQVSWYERGRAGCRSLEKFRRRFFHTLSDRLQFRAKAVRSLGTVRYY